MRKPKLLHSLLLSLLLLFLWRSDAFAVTDFHVAVRNSGGDYTSFANAESAFDNNLTDAVVLSHGGITGSMADGGTATGQTSGATGTIAHVSSNQILIYGITGTFQNAEDICSDSPTCSNKVTSSSAPDDARVLVTIYNNFNGVTIDGGTFSSVHTITYQGDPDVWDGTTNGGIKSSSQIRVQDDYVTIKNFVITHNGRGAVYFNSSGNSPKGINIITINGGFRTYTTEATFINCVSLNSTQEAFVTHSSASSKLYCYNCVAINATLQGFVAANRFNGYMYAYNSFACGNTEGDFVKLGGYYYGDHNASCDETADDLFLNYQISLSIANELVDGENGDFHIKTGSNLIDAGYDYSGTTGVDYDIDNVTRSGTWDIGADEYVASSMITNTIRGAIIRGAIVH